MGDSTIVRPTVKLNSTDDSPVAPSASSSGAATHGVSAAPSPEVTTAPPASADSPEPIDASSASPSPADPTRTSQRTQNPHPPPAVDGPIAIQLRDPSRYRVVGEHGRGGLGRVSRAHDVELGRDVAIKELISRGHVSEVRFLREALITARLEHPGIVPVHEAGRWPDGTPFY